MKLLNSLTVLASIAFLASCSPQRQLSRSAKAAVLDNAALQTAHIGISIYEPATGKYWYNHQGDKYFVPASNTKIPTCYAAMKYLGDSLVGLRYAVHDSQLYIMPAADPTLLHRDFKNQPVYAFLKSANRKLAYVLPKWQDKIYGAGWTWSDYNESYMPERSALPIYGNTLMLSYSEVSKKVVGDIPYFRYKLEEKVDPGAKKVRVERRMLDNTFDILPAGTVFQGAEIPFQTFENARLLEDTLKNHWLDNVYQEAPFTYKVIHSQPTDSLLKPMMHRSDNFFAEQALLMVSNEKLGIMSDARIIDTLLKTDFKDLPQAPRWVDGSGLSRYNLFTPQDMVAILNKMQMEFGMNRIKTIFATGNEGTLANYYKAESGYLYAKTGTLSGVVAISGFLETAKGKHLIFSVLVNNHQASATAVRRAVEAFIEGIRDKF